MPIRGSPRGRGPDARRNPRAPPEPASLRPPAGAASPRATASSSRASASMQRQLRGLPLRPRLLRSHRGGPVHAGGLGCLSGPLPRGDLHGKGLYEVDAFLRVCRAARAGERAPVARPLRGALRADGARLGCPARGRLSRERTRARAPPAPLDARRLADPRVALPLRPSRRGFARNRLPLVSQWKILDNLRRSLVAPALLALFAAAWTVLPGNPLVFTLGGLAVVGVPARRHAVPPAAEAHRVRLRRAGARLRARRARGRPRTVVRTGLPHARALLPFHAWETVHAVGLDAGPSRRHPAPPPRLGDGRHAGGCAAAGLLAGRRPRVRGRDGREPDRGGLRSSSGGGRSRGPPPFRSPCRSPSSWDLGVRSSRTGSASLTVRSRAGASARGPRGGCRRIAAKTWGYFETLVGREEDKLLLPDNVQHDRGGRRRAPDVAHERRDGAPVHALRARPRPRDCSRGGRSCRLERTLGTVESLEKHEGHLLN